MFFVTHGCAKGLAGRFIGIEGMKIRGVYLMLAKEYKAQFLVKKGN
jgi:hypothetical protein